MNTVADTRHANLLVLISEAGSVQAFADKIERSHSQVSQLKNRAKHSKSGQPREIGDEFARHVEERLALPRGWMDQSHDRDALPSDVQLTEEVAAELAKREVGPEVRAAIRQLLQSSPLKKRSNQ